MDQKLKDLEKSCTRQATVCPHWLPGGDAFWYTREAEAGKSEFILVDCITGLRRPAFDHIGLAAELGKRTEQEVGSDNFPFWWINIARDGAWTRFQFDEQTWQYGNSGTLELWHGDFDNGNFEKGCKEVPSPPDSHHMIAITFANHTTTSIAYSWIDEAGEPRRYGSVGAGQRRTQQSYVGHIWRLTAQDSGKNIACAVKDKPSVVIIEELPSTLTLRWETDKGSEDSDSAQHTTKSEPGLVAFVRDCNVWVRNSDGTERPISTDGFIDNEFKEDCIYPSTDGKYAVAWQCKPGTKRLIHMVESSPKNQLQPKLSSIPYLKPGDNVEVKRPRLFDLVARQEILVDDNLFRKPYALTNIGWSKDGKKYRFVFNERGHQHLRLLEIGLGGAVKVLVDESSGTFIDYYNKMYHKIMESKDEILWTSERDGWNHLYLFDLKDGTLKNQVTKGEWVIRSVESVDEDMRRIWFQGYGMVPGQDPYYAHLACVNFDGSGLRVVTEGDGTHTWKWSLDKRFLIDSWSRVDFPPCTAVRDAETGKEIVQLEQVRVEPLIDAGWVAPERFAAPGRDSQTSIYGVIIRPTDLDPSKKDPVLEQIYAGPQGYYTPKTFQTFPNSRRLADQGYILVLLDGMGTNWRSKAFHNVAYKNLKDGGFPDRIAWIRSAAETRPWMDLSRVGCYGGSAGGQNAAAAVLHHSDFYKAASASAGCHDNRMDKLWWNELWMGYPVDDSYRESSNVTHAHKLGGALMLAVGEMDTNVDPSSTMQLVHALIEADKDFDLVFVPGGDHHVSSLPYVMRKQDRFFQRHLQDC
jgi:dipeptidyl-peptidase-4